ncbi:hypothetical protein IA57_00470 [Mangrovimonas yunxiaonensis]|uniref:YhhN-like protein n=1 Tax=Mangrovimonas yunxiaonensis TaxID=1197477 RepID=A0A084TN65_9FLAO|nr:hypothetical protein [Mangrovimonas yunxiaonensis]KFB02151.1 hypothetical protein IA57_00470 [Mangrovimonas yunxiaonensis]
MKKLFKANFNALFIGVLFSLLLLTLVALLSENEGLLWFLKPIYVPVFFLFFYVKQRAVGLVFLFFYLFSFLGDFLSVFHINQSVVEFSGLFYFLSYLGLIFYAFTRLKTIAFDKVIGLYLLLVLAVNSYFLYELFWMLQFSASGAFQVGLYVLKSSSLVALLFVSFVVYLNNDSKQAITFLIMALCFVFSDVLYYIINYYIYNDVFAVIERVLHLAGLLFLYKYVLMQTMPLRRRQQKRVQASTLSVPDNVLT